MAHSYDRWRPVRPISWPGKVFIRHLEEHRQMMWAFVRASKYAFKMLGQTGAQRTDPADRHFDVGGIGITVLHWQDSFSAFTNWTNLNQLLAINACLETYIASMLRLVFDSDPGLIVGASHSIDGVRQLKFSIKIDPAIVKNNLVDCTKDTWSKREAALQRIFGHQFPTLFSYIGELENLRTTRNQVGHAFGRPIDASQKYDTPDKLPMARVSAKRVTKLMGVINKIVREIDAYIMANHVGNYQEFHFLHNLRLSTTPPTAAITPDQFREKLNQHAHEVYSKQFCQWALNTYTAL